MPFIYSTRPLIPINVTSYNYASPPFISYEAVHTLDPDMLACGPGRRDYDLHSRSDRVPIGGAPAPLAVSTRGDFYPLPPIQYSDKDSEGRSIRPTSSSPYHCAPPSPFDAPYFHPTSTFLRDDPPYSRAPGVDFAAQIQQPANRLATLSPNVGNSLVPTPSPSFASILDPNMYPQAPAPCAPAAKRAPAAFRLPIQQAYVPSVMPYAGPAPSPPISPSFEAVIPGVTMYPVAPSDDEDDFVLLDNEWELLISKAERIIDA